MNSSTPDTNTVYLLNLDSKGAPDIAPKGGYIQLPAPVSPYILRFAIQGASSICREGCLWINVPENGRDFDRSKFREIKYVDPPPSTCAKMPLFSIEERAN
jgi:glycogen debranching enzyme